MAKKRKKFLVTNNSEAYACSLVTSPAVEETFVAFNEEKPLVEKFADDKKHMITGVVAIPNKPIYRRTEDGEEYDIVFSAEAIESMSKDFLKNYRQHNVTLQHNEDAEGIYLVEQWIKTDMVYDKSISVGLSKELPIGSWIQTYYVDSNDVWKRIEEGELLGFSLECMLGLEEFEKQVEQINNDKIEINMSEDTFLQKIKTIIMEALGKKEEKVEEEFEEETVETPNEAVETPSEPSNDVEATDTNEEAKEEPTEQINEPKEEAVEEPKEEKVEEPKEDNHLEELINNLRAEIDALKEVNSGLQDKIKDLGKQPSAKPIKVNANGKSANNYSEWRDVMRNYLG